MMLEPSDLKRLRLPFAAALVLVGIGIAAVLPSENYLAQARILKKAAHDQLAAAKDRVAKVSEEEAEIRSNLVTFQKIVNLGMTGEEKRLEWIEALAAIQKQRRLFEVHYNLDPQRPVDYPGTVQGPKSGDAVFMATRLKLDLLLLHEEDLLNFLADLKAHGESYASVRSCSVSRTDSPSTGGGPLRPRLGANCIVDMITLKAADKP